MEIGFLQILWLALELVAALTLINIAVEIIWYAIKKIISFIFNINVEIKSSEEQMEELNEKLEKCIELMEKNDNKV